MSRYWPLVAVVALIVAIPAFGRVCNEPRDIDDDAYETDSAAGAARIR
ncbi:MAG TPA: hypothetical protein VFK32_02450 [Tepidiformaceae bacterium]|nr:hypothetical protein [Tepidiformaceae bacterium]